MTRSNNLSSGRLPDGNTIRGMLADAITAHVVDVVVLEQTASTNDYLLYQVDVRAAGFYACLAAAQTAGKGRRGCKVWHSPDNGNLYLSVLNYSQEVTQARSAWLPLIVAVEVVASLRNEYGLSDLRLKWPNDIYRGKGKLGGVLVESKNDRCVAGLGLNVYSPVSDGWQPGTSWSSLAISGTERGAGNSFDRERLIVLVLSAMIRAFHRVVRDNEDRLIAAWRRYDLLADREVTVLTANGEVHGIARGLDARGGLRIEYGHQQTRVYYSEEVSVRW